MSTSLQRVHLIVSQFNPQIVFTATKTSIMGSVSFCTSGVDIFFGQAPSEMLLKSAVRETTKLHNINPENSNEENNYLLSCG